MRDGFGKFYSTQSLAKNLKRFYPSKLTKKLAWIAAKKDRKLTRKCRGRYLTF